MASAQSQTGYRQIRRTIRQSSGQSCTGRKKPDMQNTLSTKTL